MVDDPPALNAAHIYHQSVNPIRIQNGTYDLFAENPVLEAFLREADILSPTAIVDDFTDLSLSHPDIPLRTFRTVEVGRTVPATFEELHHHLHSKVKTKQRLHPISFRKSGATAFAKVRNFLRTTKYDLVSLGYSSKFLVSPPKELNSPSFLNSLVNVVTALRVRQLAGLEVHDNPFEELVIPPSLNPIVELS